MADGLAVGDHVTIDPAKLTGQAQRMLKGVDTFRVSEVTEGQVPTIVAEYEGGQRRVLVAEIMPAIVSVEH